MDGISTKFGHVKGQLGEGKQLTGKLLEFALSVVGQPRGSSSNDELLRSIRRKLVSGDQLSEYEHHIMVDVLLLHTRVGARSRRDPT